jgi:GTP:adenosylcobinamide-phosphate guanylyltransferase
MDAIVTAGGIPEPGDPLYQYTQGSEKALVPIAGKPMIQWVLDAVCLSETIERVVVIGLNDDTGISCSKLAAFLPSHGEMLDNIRAGTKKLLEFNPQVNHVMVVSSDIPAITAPMVDWVAQAVKETDHDVYYNVVSREAMEKRFPDSKRSYLRLRDVEVCGGDLNAFRAKSVFNNLEIWDRIIASRKNVLKQASLIGYDTLILVMLHALTLDKAAKLASKRLGLRGRAIQCPFAEIAMDVDKPHQLEIMQAHLSQLNLA